MTRPVMLAWPPSRSGLWRRPAWLFGRRGGDRMPAQAIYTLAVFAAAIVIMWLIGRSRPR